MDKHQSIRYRFTILHRLAPLVADLSDVQSIWLKRGTQAHARGLGLMSMPSNGLASFSCSHPHRKASALLLELTTLGANCQLFFTPSPFPHPIHGPRFGIQENAIHAEKYKIKCKVIHPSIRLSYPFTVIPVGQHQHIHLESNLKPKSPGPDFWRSEDPSREIFFVGGFEIYVSNHVRLS